MPEPRITAHALVRALERIPGVRSEEEARTPAQRLRLLAWAKHSNDAAMFVALTKAADGIEGDERGR